MIFARTINKIPEFYVIFARKMPKFFIIIARKIFFPNFRGHVPSDPRLLRLWCGAWYQHCEIWQTLLLCECLVLSGLSVSSITSFSAVDDTLSDTQLLGYAQYTPPMVTRWNCFVALASAVWTQFATSSRRLPTDSVDNLETRQTDSIAVWLHQFL